MIVSRLKKTDEQVLDELDRMVDEWHRGSSECPIEDHLGMTRDEYSDYVESGIIPERFYWKIA